MNYFYKLLFFTLLLPVFSYAQTNYKPGYIVNIKGDTLKGYIDLREWELNPRKINFKTSASDSQIRTVGPADITFFNVAGLESFQLYVGKLNQDPTNISNLSSGRDTTTIIDSVFLRIIQKGKNVTLYELIDKIKTHFFISETTDNIPVELTYSIYLSDSKTVYENGFMRQLYALALKYNADNENLKIEIERADYTFGDLEKITAKINNISKNEMQTARTRGKGTIFFVGVGLNANTFTMHDVFVDGEATSSTSLFPHISAGLNVLANPNVGRFIFRIEAALGGSKLNHTESSSGGDINYKLDQYTLSIMPQFVYNFYNNENFKVYGDLGASLNISRYKNNTFNLITSDGLRSVLVDDALNLAKGWTSLLIKAGIVVNKKFDVSLAYSPQAAFTESTGYDVVVSSIQAGINYNF